MPKVNANAKVNLWVGNQENPDDRLKLSVSKADRGKANAIPRESDETFWVYDIRTGKHYELKRADCGLGCRCAVELISSQNYPPRKEKTRRILIPLTEDEKDAVVDLFNEAWGDQRHYLDNGNVGADYGEEWALVAETKAETFERGAAVLVKVGATGLAESFRKLAADFRESK